MLKYMALKLSVNTLHSTVTQALMALSMYHRLLVYTCSPIIFVTYARLILIVVYTAMTIMTEGISLHAVTFMVKEVESTNDVNRGLEPYQSSTALTFPVLCLHYQA